jgi:hypothetical protein
MGQFVFEHFNFNPLEATVFLSLARISANIDHGVACGIIAQGCVDVAEPEIGIDLLLAPRKKVRYQGITK